MTTKNPIRILIADDHTMFRQGLKEMLSIDPGIEVVGQAGNGREAVEVCRKVRPDVITLDVEMPVLGAREAMDSLLKNSPRPKILIVTMFESPRLVRELLAAGASGYLVKSASMEELISAVHTIAHAPNGGNVRRPGSPEGSPGTRRAGPENEPSTRELEVLLLAARGFSNRQISVSLRLSESTVKRHLANLYPKIKVSSRGEATRKALSEGWITARDVTRDAES